MTKFKLECAWKFEGVVCPHGVGKERQNKSYICEDCEIREIVKDVKQ